MYRNTGLNLLCDATGSDSGAVVLN